MGEIALALEGITKKYGDVTAVSELSIGIEKGEFITLLGPSGCGKTTVLRCVAGLEPLDSGRIVLGGEDVTHREPNQRNLNTVFQSYALFPHMNVFSNIAYGQKIRKVPKDEISKRVEKMLEMVELQGYAKRMPDQLSGGQRQRVAIARAIINRPDVLLLDEPLGALDLKLRRQIQGELKQIQRKSGITFIYVTHDQEEALNMSDRIAVMREGRIVQLGHPDDIFERPATRFVADFIGDTNLMEANVVEVSEPYAKLSFGGGVVLCPNEGFSSGQSVCLSVRPGSIYYGSEPLPEFSLRARVISHTYTGLVIKTQLALPDGKILTANSNDSRKALPEEGSEVFVSWKPQKAAVVHEE